jgi:hypothetical protein
MWVRLCVFRFSLGQSFPFDSKFRNFSSFCQILAGVEKWLSSYKIFIVQPAFVTKEMFDSVIEEVKSKKDLVSLHKVTFEILEEGLCAQILYVGAYKDEGKTIENLHAFIKNKGYTLVKKHHEIYLSDMRKTAPEKLKTILRQPIVK